MFPTRSKTKLPKTLTYPLKAKVLSEALADVPQAQDFQLWFSNSRTPTKLRELTEYSLIDVKYSHRGIDQFTPRHFEESGFNDPKWSIHVYAVPVEIRARVTQLLQDEALPKVRAWLHTKSDVENQRHCRIEVIYCEADDRLQYSRFET